MLPLPGWLLGKPDVAIFKVNSTQGSQLPGPELYSEAANLLNEINKRILCYMRDGKIFIGSLQSVDQYGNLLLR